MWEKIWRTGSNKEIKEILTKKKRCEDSEVPADGLPWSRGTNEWEKNIKVNAAWKNGRENNLEGYETDGFGRESEEYRG